MSAKIVGKVLVIVLVLGVLVYGGAFAAEVREGKAVTGVVGKAVERRMVEAKTDLQRELLAGYKEDTDSFRYTMESVYATSDYSLYNVRFPSNYVSPYEENNTVYCEYYTANVPGRRPAVIVLDILAGSKVVSRILAYSLVCNGVDACIVTLPYYDQRRPGGKDVRVSMVQDMTVLVDAVRQGVMDVRRTARWLSSCDTIDRGQIGVCGTSLGGFIAALSAGVDGRFSKAAVLLAGGDLATVLSTDEREVRAIKAEIVKRGINEGQLKELLREIEPLNFSDRLGQTDLLMISGSKDTIVPPECARLLAEKAGVEIEWYPADHYGMVTYIIPIVAKVCEHFNANKKDHP